MQLTKDDVGRTSKWLPYFVVFSASLFFFYEFIQGNMFASIADNLMQDFQIDAQGVTYLSTIYYFSNVLFLFIAGYVLDHYSPKKTLLFAMFLCVGSTFIFAHTTHFYMALLCRFITGIGSAFCFLGPIRVASRWFPLNKMAMVTGLVVTFAMTGGILSQYPLTLLVNEWGWRLSVQGIAWFGLILWVVMFLGIQENRFHAGRHDGIKISICEIFKKIYLNGPIIKAAMYTSLMNMAVAVFGAMMGILYLMQRCNISKSEAAVINSMLFLGSIVGGPLVGWISDQWGKRVVPMKIAAVMTLWIILCIMYAPIGKVGMGSLFFLLGLVTAAQVISYALVAESCSPKMTAMAVSAISVLTQGGYVVYQNLYSFLLTHFSEHAGLEYGLRSFQSAAIILPLGVGLAYALIGRLQDVHSREMN
jgi:MFS family permease